MEDISYNESFIALCKNLKNRKLLRNKNRALEDISTMMSLIGYNTEYIDTNNFSGKSLLCSKSDNFKHLIIADYNVRDVIYFKYRQRINDQTRNKRKVLNNLTLIFFASLTIGLFGIYFISNYYKVNRLLFLLGFFLLFLSFLIPRRQDVFNLSKTAALYTLIEIGKQIDNNEIALCFLNESGNEQGMVYLEKKYPNTNKIYINQIGNNEKLYVQTKNNNNLFHKLKDRNDLVDKLDNSNNSDSLIRQFNRGILITTCDINDMTCKMPGTINDDETDLDFIDKIIDIIRLL